MCNQCCLSFNAGAALEVTHTFAVCEGAASSRAFDFAAPTSPTNARKVWRLDYPSDIGDHFGEASAWLNGQPLPSRVEQNELVGQCRAPVTQSTAARRLH